MIVVINLKDAETYRKVDFDIYDLTISHKCWGATPVPDLAPSSGLFQATRICIEQKLWSWDRWMAWYVPEYLKELRERPSAQVQLEAIASKYGHNDTRNACIGCWCKQEMMCHRSIVAGILKGMGARVITKTQQDYLLYYHMWKGELDDRPNETGQPSSAPASAP